MDDAGDVSDRLHIRYVPRVGQLAFDRKSRAAAGRAHDIAPQDTLVPQQIETLQHRRGQRGRWLSDFDQNRALVVGVPQLERLLSIGRIRRSLELRNRCLTPELQQFERVGNRQLDLSVAANRTGNVDPRQTHI